MTKHRRIQPHEAKGFLFGILAALMYATMATFVKFSWDITNETLIFFRNLICLMIVLPSFLVKHTSLATKKMPLHFSRAIFGLLAIYAYFYAIKHLPLTNAILLATTIPLFTPLVVFVWLKYRVPRRRIFALILGFIGVVIVLRPFELSFEFASFMALLAGLFGSIATVSIRQLSKTEPIQRIMFYFFVICVVLSFFPMLFTYEPVDATAWFFIVGVGISAVLFQLFLTKAFTYAPATKVSSLMYLNVIFGGLSSWFFFGQVPSLWLFIGACFIILGGVLALLDKKNPVKMS